MSAHKLYGPKGIGALYVRSSQRVELEAQMDGGGHEQGLRSGTLPSHQIVDLSDALARAAVRISLGRHTRAADVDHLLAQLRVALGQRSGLTSASSSMSACASTGLTK